MRRGLVTLARIIGRRFGVEVVVDRSVATAATDGKRILVPPLDLASEEDAVLIEGLIDHEAMHCRLTEFEVRGESALVDAVANIFEDVWGESDFARIYPGTRGTIRRAAEIMVERGIIGQKLEPGASPAELMGSVLVNGLRSHVLGQDCLEEAYLHNLVLLQEAIGAELAERIWDTALEVREIHGTREAYALARRVLELLKSAQQEDQPQGQCQNQQDPQQGQGEQDQEGQDPQQGQGSGGDQQAGDQQGQNQRDPQQGQGEQQATPAGRSAAQAAAVEQILAAGEGEFGKTDLGEMAEKGVGQMSRCDDTQAKVERVASAPGWDAGISGRAAKLRNTLAARLSHLFDTQTETRVWLDKSGRRLDKAVLASVPTGREHVFRKVEEGDELSVEVSLVVDCSGSMTFPFGRDDVSRIEGAQSVVLALGDVLERHDIPFSVTLFADSVCAYKRESDSWLRARRQNMDLKHYKRTRTREAVLEGSKDLLFSECERRIMLVVTDGVPDDVESAVAESAEIQRTGIEVRYVMVGDGCGELVGALAQAGIPSGQASVPEELAKAVFDAIEPRKAIRAAA